MKTYKLKTNFKEHKRGTLFYLVSESEFIGVKEFILRTEDLRSSLSINEKELLTYFVFIRNT
ncbi:hypothetical protein [Fredinandcohnia sp. 179-A 10B2 NHS]|uniref:hypothetical protein n=1 Tax=Fredinandcohnia sp. 179-A 10B2 NHS TaxID=3235176 RepID=UPI0039A11359